MYNKKELCELLKSFTFITSPVYDSGILSYLMYSKWLNSLCHLKPTYMMQYSLNFLSVWSYISYLKKKKSKYYFKHYFLFIARLATERKFSQALSAALFTVVLCAQAICSVFTQLTECIHTLFNNMQYCVYMCYRNVIPKYIFR